MKKPTTEELKKEIAKREWDEKSAQFMPMLGRFYKRAGEKGSSWNPFNKERTPELPQYFHPTQIVVASGLIARTPAMEGEWFAVEYDGSKSFIPKRSQFWESDWEEISQDEFEKAWKQFCVSVATSRVPQWQPAYT